jgi:hypothetical protein
MIMAAALRSQTRHQKALYAPEGFRIRNVVDFQNYTEVVTTDILVAVVIARNKVRLAMEVLSCSETNM